MTPLQQRMIEDMTIRGLAPSTQHAYLGFVRDTCNEVSQQESSRKVYDTVGEFKSAEICVSHMPSWKAKTLGKLTQERVLL